MTAGKKVATTIRPWGSSLFHPISCFHTHVQISQKIFQKILHIRNWLDILQCASITDKNVHGFTTTAHLNVATTTKLPIINSHWVMLSCGYKPQNIIFCSNCNATHCSGPSKFQLSLFDLLNLLVDLLVFLNLLDFEEFLAFCTFQIHLLLQKLSRSFLFCQFVRNLPVPICFQFLYIH